MDKIEWKRRKGYGQPTAVNGSRRGVGLVYCEGYCGFHDGNTTIQVVINRDGSVIIHLGLKN
jgi:hypothetical protein